MKDYLEAFPEILRYGVTGLSALVFYFTFLLLKQQNAKKTPDTSMLQTIKYFMGIAVILAVISLVDAGLRSRNEVAKQSVEVPQKMISIKGIVKRGDVGILSNRAEIYLLPTSVKEYVTLSDDQGKFILESVPDTNCNIVVRYLNPDFNPTVRGLIFQDDVKDTLLLNGTTVDFQKIW